MTRRNITYLLDKSSVFALIILASFIGVFGVTAIIAYNFDHDKTNNAILSNEARANLLAKVIQEHEEAAVGILRSYANRPSLLDAVKAKNVENAMIHLESLINNNLDMGWPFISNPDSTVWVNFPYDQRSMNKDLSERDWYKGVRREWDPYVSSVYKMIVGEQDLAVAVSTPIFAEKGKVIGILSTAQNISSFQKIIGEIGVCQNIKISLVDKDGYIIYSNRFPYKKEIISYPSFGFLQETMNGKRGNTEIRDSSDNNMTKYLSYEPVEGLGWSVILEIEKGEILQSELPDFLQFAVISILIFAMIVIFLAHTRQRHKQVTALQESGNRLKLLASQLLTAQENERKLVALELHDSIGASLSAAKFKIEQAIKEFGKNPETNTALNIIPGVLQEAIDDARRIQMALRPSLLDDLGILATINWFCRNFEKTYCHIQIRLKIKIEESEVPDPLKIVIFRVLQEAFSNIAKHSKANRIDLLFQKIDGVIELKIQDNGRGFIVSEALSRIGADRRLGLTSMRERIEYSGGSFSIESDNGIGTVIRAMWPIEQLSP